MDNALSKLDWSLVQSFIAVAESGSLSGAARNLGLSQPTLGRQIKALEQQIGAELFLRQPRGLVPTQAGAALLTPAQAMQDAAARLALTAAGQQERLAGTVRITASVATSLWHLPPIIARIRREEPGIEVELVPSDESRNLLFREADIAVRMFRPTQLDIVARHVGELELGIFAAESYLADKPPLHGFEDLLDHDWVGYDSQSSIIDGMAAAGTVVDRHFFGTRCDDNSAYIALIRAGCGIGFAQTSIARHCPDLQRIDIGLPLPTLPIWLAVPEPIRHTPRIARVWDILLEDLKPLVC